MFHTSMWKIEGNKSSPKNGCYWNVYIFISHADGVRIDPKLSTSLL